LETITFEQIAEIETTNALPKEVLEMQAKEKSEKPEDISKDNSDNNSD
jgi:hypothetical protein